MNTHASIFSLRRLGLATSLFAVLAVGAPGEAWAQEAPSADPDPFVAVTAKIRPSVAAIGSYHRKDTPTVKYAGTGFVVGDGNLAATNWHVVEAVRRHGQIENLRVFFPGDTTVAGRPAKVLKEDRLHDVAVVRFDGPPMRPLTLRSTRLPHPPQGLAVGIIGYPVGLKLGLVPAVHGGRLAAVVPAVLPLPKGAKLKPQLVEAIDNPYQVYQLDIVAMPGNSGSPLFDARTGQVIGIINKVLGSRTREHLIEHPTGISYAVPGRWVEEMVIRSLIEAKKQKPSTPANGAATRR